MVNNWDDYLQYLSVHGHDERTNNQAYAIVDCLNTHNGEKSN